MQNVNRKSAVLLLSLLALGACARDTQIGTGGEIPRNSNGEPIMSEVDGRPPS